MRSDSDIKRDVEQELRWDADIDSTDIAVAGQGQRSNADRLCAELRAEMAGGA